MPRRAPSSPAGAGRPRDAQAIPAPTGRPYGGLAPDERRARRRQRFLEAGLEVFGTVGFRAATVRGVCAVAGLTDRYFYESFEGLEALLEAVHGSLVAGLRDVLFREALAETAWTRTEAGIAAQAAHGYALWFDAVRDPRVARVLLVEVLGVSAAMDARYEAATDDLAAHTMTAVDLVLGATAMTPERRALVGRALAGAALHVARRWVATGYAAPRDEVVRTCVLVAMGTLGALRADVLVSRTSPVSG